MRFPHLLAIVGLALSAATAHADSRQTVRGDIVIDQKVVRASIGHSPNSAAYMTVFNRGGAPDRLMSASCACAAKVEAHISEQMDGMMMMSDTGPVVIPSHGEVTFQPGGRHLMITGLKARLVDGGRQEITLTFEHAGAVKANFDIKANIAAGGSPTATH